MMVVMFRAFVIGGWTKLGFCWSLATTVHTILLVLMLLKKLEMRRRRCFQSVQVSVHARELAKAQFDRALQVRRHEIRPPFKHHAASFAEHDHAVEEPKDVFPRLVDRQQHRGATPRYPAQRPHETQRLVWTNQYKS